MSFEIINYDHKRVRQSGSREWKLWYSATDAGLAFRLLTKDNGGDCYLSLTGVAALDEGDAPIQEDENGDAIPADRFRFADGEGQVSIYIDREDGGLAWVQGQGGYGTGDCTFTVPGPLMPEVAG